MTKRSINGPDKTPHHSRSAVTTVVLICFGLLAGGIPTFVLIRFHQRIAFDPALFLTEYGKFIGSLSVALVVYLLVHELLRLRQAGSSERLQHVRLLGALRQMQQATGAIMSTLENSGRQKDLPEGAIKSIHDLEGLTNKLELVNAQLVVTLANQPPSDSDPQRLAETIDIGSDIHALAARVVHIYRSDKAKAVFMHDASGHLCELETKLRDAISKLQPEG